ncbi:MAG: hypothetical protein COA44_11070 [Arcobacter sp.]|nr:MAG: hypothetical protein COA44_11070 [Arcobacter sp.]
MTYILSAFEAEARALIDKYNLVKTKSGKYVLYKNEELLVFISGMGQDNAHKATQYLLLNFPNKKDDLFINLGICAAQNFYEIGQLLQIYKLQDTQESYLLKTVNSDIQSVSCFSSTKVLNRPVNEDIAEMEAMSIYKEVRTYFKPSHISFLKVVSDNFNPVKFNKGFIISLMNKNLDPIMQHIQNMKEINL